MQACVTNEYSFAKQGKDLTEKHFHNNRVVTFPEAIAVSIIDDKLKSKFFEMSSYIPHLVVTSLCFSLYPFTDYGIAAFDHAIFPAPEMVGFYKVFGIWSCNIIM